jgi:hypothetical protein
VTPGCRFLSGFESVPILTLLSNEIIFSNQCNPKESILGDSKMFLRSSRRIIRTLGRLDPALPVVQAALDRQRL